MKVQIEANMMYAHANLSGWWGANSRYAETEKKFAAQRTAEEPAFLRNRSRTGAPADLQLRASNRARRFRLRGAQL